MSMMNDQNAVNERLQTGIDYLKDEMSGLSKNQEKINESLETNR